MCKQLLQSKLLLGIWHPYFVVGRTSFKFRTRDGYPDLVNKANLVHNFSQNVYLFSLHVSGDYVPIIRRNSCIYATLDTCHSVWATVWYAGWNDSHPYRVTSTACFNTRKHLRVFCPQQYICTLRIILRINRIKQWVFTRRHKRVLFQVEINI